GKGGKGRGGSGKGSRFGAGILGNAAAGPGAGAAGSGGSAIDDEEFSRFSFGTSTIVWHFGQRVFFRANLWATLNFAWQFGPRQRISITAPTRVCSRTRPDQTLHYRGQTASRKQN